MSTHSPSRASATTVPAGASAHETAPTERQLTRFVLTLGCFDADRAHKTFEPDPDSRLIWCPNNGRERIAAFIDSAKETLWLQNERYQDTVMIEHLVRAVKRGYACTSWRGLLIR